jgi:Protein of unknown function (DUF2793)
MSNAVDFGIPYLPGAEQRPAILQREGLTTIQALLNGVIDRDVNIPPSNPDEGDAYIIGAAPTGQWAGHANQVTVWADFGAGGAWRFIPGRDSAGAVIPMGARQAGMHVYVRAESALVIWSGSAWASLSSGGGGASFEPWGANATFVDFVIVVSNQSGVLSHRIQEPNTSISPTAPSLADVINGASDSDTATPTGADSGTAFATGVKISTTYGSHVLAIDTPDCPIGEGALQTTIENSNAGSVPFVYIDLLSANINGVTRTRPNLVLANASTGTALNWVSFLSSGGKFIRVHVRGWLQMS